MMFQQMQAMAQKQVLMLYHVFSIIFFLIHEWICCIFLSILLYFYLIFLFFYKYRFYFILYGKTFERAVVIRKPILIEFSSFSLSLLFFFFLL